MLYHDLNTLTSGEYFTGGLGYLFNSHWAEDVGCALCGTLFTHTFGLTLTGTIMLPHDTTGWAGMTLTQNSWLVWNYFNSPGSISRVILWQLRAGMTQHVLWGFAV